MSEFTKNVLAPRKAPLPGRTDFIHGAFLSTRETAVPVRTQEKRHGGGRVPSQEPEGVSSMPRVPAQGEGTFASPCSHSESITIKAFLVLRNFLLVSEELPLIVKLVSQDRSQACRG